jgi:hypothetical protein
MGQKSPRIEINRRFDDGPCNVRIRREVDDGVVPSHCPGNALELGRIPADDPEPRILGVFVEMPLPPRREIVENGH